jgi:SAM-dependent methyltransferase
MRELRALLNRMPILKRLLKNLRGVLVPNSSVSSHYIEIDHANAGVQAADLRSAWKSDALPTRQRALVDRQLVEFHAGKPVDVFDVFVQSLHELDGLAQLDSLLEIGCSSGFYSEVLKIADLPLEYTGCDYSDAFIALAKERYPNLSFDVADATNLGYKDETFDIAVSGCCLLHIPEYEKAIAETARVASHYAIFHRTPMVLGQPTKYFKKLAYGVQTVEIHFNEPDFLVLLEKYNLRLVKTYTLNEELSSTSPRVGTANRTYVCQKLK